jgi:hypothetical protein
MAYKFQSKELAKLAARVRGTGKPKRRASAKRRRVRRKTTVKRAAPRRRVRRKTTVKRAAPRRRAVSRKKTKAEIHAMRVRQGKRLAAMRKRQLGGRKSAKRKARR